ncbi:serine/threonine-protein kinase [Sphaerimonospora sp. CA-214678]|uniref:serine/threonine-protein kinase n=1 Tax=Sphaerimonospora sp. CA-214678 TaxID=3240029 RepID=UPI003D8DCEE0
MGTAGQLLVRRYRLVRALGQGGTGIVWEGHDTLLDRPIAVRQVLLPPNLGETRRIRFAQRVARAARQAERLRHPGIAAVYDVAEDDGTPYIVMELVRSRSLDGIVASDGPLPPDRAVSVARTLLAALAYAHAEGVRHGDVRPSNVLFGHDGRVLLADFGIGALAADPAFAESHSRAEHTERAAEPAGAARGVRAFLAPERADGGALTTASDMWALGATLHFAITGRPPGAASPEPPREQGGEPGRSPEDVLRTVVSGLLTRDPRKRLDPQAADRLLAEIEPAAPPPPAGESRTRLSRSRLMAGIAAAAVVAGAAGGWAILRPEPTDARIPLAANASGPAPDLPATASATPSASTSAGASRLRLRWHDSPAGWRAAVPRQWTAEQAEFSARWTDPEGRAQFSVEVTAQSGTDPLGMLREAEAMFKAKDYRKLRLRTISSKHGTAADWEFTWTRRAASGEGHLAGRGTYRQVRRVLSTGTTTSVLTWTTRAADWERLRPTLTRAFALFRPPAG